MSSNTHSLNSTTLPSKASSLPASSNPSPQSQILCQKTSPRKQTISSLNLNSHLLNAQSNKKLNEFNEGQFIENNYKVNKSSEFSGLKKLIGNEIHEGENIKCFINKESFKDGVDKTKIVERDENKIKEKENNINITMKDKPKELVLKALNKRDNKEKDSVLVKNKEKARTEEKNVNKSKDKDKAKDSAKGDEKNKEKPKPAKTIKKKLEQDTLKSDNEVKIIKPTIQQIITKNLDIPVKKDNILITGKGNEGGDNVIGDFPVVSKPQGPESTIDKKSAGNGDKTDSDDKKDGKDDKNDNRKNNNNKDNDNNDNNNNNNNNNNNSVKDEKAKPNNVVIKSYTRVGVFFHHELLIIAILQ